VFVLGLECSKVGVVLCRKTPEDAGCGQVLIIASKKEYWLNHMNFALAVECHMPPVESNACWIYSRSSRACALRVASEGAYQCG